MSSPISSVHFSSVTQFSSVQFSRSVVSDSGTPWIAAHQTSLSITNSQSLLKLMPIESVLPSNHLILCHPLLHLPSIFPTIGIFSNESALCIRWPKYWSFSFNISPSNEYSGLISFRMDCLDLLASPRGSQESSPTPQFKSINSLALSFLYSPTHIHTWLLEKPLFFRYNGYWYWYLKYKLPQISRWHHSYGRN